MNNFDPAYQQTWALFQQQMIQQQQQQMMMQYQFQMYQQFCFMRGLDPTNKNSFNNLRAFIISSYVCLSTSLLSCNFT